MSRVRPVLAAAAALAPAAALLGAAAAPAQTAPLKVLVTNDDGVRAVGIDLLTNALRAEPDVAVTVVAPQQNRSGTGGTTSPLPVKGYPAATRSGYPAWSVNGTPADSVNYALGTLKLTPDVVISGLNDGANLGPIADGSGTIGAARAAARRGYPALATSQGSGGPARFADGVVASITWFRANRGALKPGTVANLNTPTCRFATKPLGIASVRAATALSYDFLTTLSPRACPAVAPVPAADDDVHAYLQGYSTLTPLPVR